MALDAAFVVPHPPLIIPAVGRGEQTKIQTTIDAYDEVGRRISRLAPETVIVTSPHATAYADYFHISPGAGARGDMVRFNARDTSLTCDYDTELVECLSSIAASEGFPAGTEYERDAELDHATYIPLHFIDKFYGDFKVVRIGLSGLGPLEHYRLGEMLADAVEQTGRRAIIVASGDLSHKLAADGPYGFAPEGPVFDEQITKAMATGDFMQLLSFEESFCDKAAECGLRSFQIMAGALDGKALDCELLSYEGPFGVGYAVASYYVTGEDASRRFASRYAQRVREAVAAARAEEDAYVALARASVESFVSQGMPLPPPADLPAEMTNERAGVFVSLHEHGRLRGCIGTTSSTTPCIAEEIIRNGICACSEDPRFEPVRPHELDQLEISVDVLGEAEPIDSANLLDPQRYGVIVTNGRRRGLLLPMLDGIDTPEEQIAIAKRKAGIGEHETCSLQRFEVVRHEAGKQPTASSTIA